MQRKLLAPLGRGNQSSKPFRRDVSLHHSNRKDQGKQGYADGDESERAESIHAPDYSANPHGSCSRYNPRMAFRFVILALLLAAGLQAADVWTWWVDDCAGAALASGCHKDDAELARWAFEAWQRESGNRIVFEKSATQRHARLTVHWLTEASLYGETRPVTVDGKPGAEIYILPEGTSGHSADPLLRDAIVFLTFVHETGHALGLRHTANFEDIMYSFQYGGDIPAYFDRYRRLLSKRADIAAHSGLSEGDRRALELTLPGTPRTP